SDFTRDGMTPPIDLVERILASVSIPIRIMIRETEEFTVTDERVVEKLCQSASAFAKLPIDGLVLGFVKNGEVDIELTRRVLSQAPNLKATFHHAFEHVDDPFKAIESLKTCDQIDRILTMGGQGSWPEKIALLSDYEKAAAPQLSILAGGGLTSQIIKEIRTSTDVREFHVGRAVRQPSTIDGVVESSLVKNLVNLINTFQQ